MNREQAKQLLPIIQAFADGETVQINCEGCWRDMAFESPIFDGPPSVYRIKPKPVECWIVHRTYCDGTTDFGFVYHKREDAQSAADRVGVEGRIVHLIEATK